MLLYWSCEEWEGPAATSHQCCYRPPHLLQVWLAMLAAEVSTCSPGAAVQSVLERAVNHDSGRHCPLLWRLYLRFEAHRGRHDAVRRWA